MPHRSQRGSGVCSLRARSTRSCGCQNFNLHWKITKNRCFECWFSEMICIVFFQSEKFVPLDYWWMDEGVFVFDFCIVSLWIRQALKSLDSGFADGQESARTCMPCFTWWMENSSVNSLSLRCHTFMTPLSCLLFFCKDFHIHIFLTWVGNSETTL